MNILVTGGAGYIGSHTCVELLQAGYQPVVIDDLSNASEKSLERVEQITGKSVPFYRGNVRDEALLERIFSEHDIGCAIHFAGYTAVGESVAKPLEYYENNLRYCKDFPFGKIMGFAEIDWIFILNRASMQTGHRREEAKALIREFADKYLDYLEEDIENTYKTHFDDLHMLFGAMCAVAEMQLALPGEIKSTIPMKNVLDRRPFI
jgi:NAD(P)-dependent dehydrogenase (short-subunit alcohol dehydrogenase family)